MKLMKKKIDKKSILIILIATIISITSSYVLAATLVNSEDVYYDKTNSGLAVNNVQAAIDGTCTKFNDQLTALQTTIINKIYPVGSIYISTNLSTVQQVNNTIGGTWEVYGSGRTLVGNDGSTYITGDTSKGQGGSATNSTKLTVANLPSHSHVIPELSGTASETKLDGHFNPLAYNDEYGNKATGVFSAAPNNISNIVANLNTTTGKFGTLGIYFDGKHSHTVTTTASNTTTCTNCTGTAFTTSTMQPYIVVYMYKRIK